MISPAIIVIAIVACSVIAAVIETIVQSRRNKFAQHMSEVSNDLADAFCKANKSVGVSCEDAIKNLEKSLTIIAETTSTNSNIWIASDYMSENRTNMITLRKPDTIVHDAASFTPRNCPNCGAPVRSGECEYCGTVFSTGNDVNVVLDVDAVASAVRRYYDSIYERETKCERRRESNV